MSLCVYLTTFLNLCWINSHFRPGLLHSWGIIWLTLRQRKKESWRERSGFGVAFSPVLPLGFRRQVAWVASTCGPHHANYTHPPMNTNTHTHTHGWVDFEKSLLDFIMSQWFHVSITHNAEWMNERSDTHSHRWKGGREGWRDGGKGRETHSSLKYRCDLYLYGYFGRCLSQKHW